MTNSPFIRDVPAARALEAWRSARDAAGCPARLPAVRARLEDAAGRVTAEPVWAARSSPPFDAAGMDGIAVRAADTLGASETAPVYLAPGAYDVVDTGDPMPAGRDAVVMREHVHYTDGSAELRAAVPPYQHVRSIGEDVSAAELLLPEGHRLRAVDLAAAAAAGATELLVRRQPVVAVLPTGDEVRPIGTQTGPGEILDTNSLMLATQAREAGCQAYCLPIEPDDPAGIAAAVSAAVTSCDLLIIVAGSSAGRDDYTATIVAQLGTLAVHGVAVRPGHPVLLGYVKPGRSGLLLPGGAGASHPPGAVPAIGVPGYPLAAAVIFELFAAPLLAQLQGSLVPDPDRLPLPARLGCDWSSPPDVEDWVLVSLNVAGEAAGLPGGHLIATPDKGRGAGAISRLVRADAWWRIPIGQGQFVSGADIHVQPTST